MQTRLLGIFVAALALASAACDPDELLEVRDPDVVLPENLSGPQAIPTVYNGALGDFGVAYNSGTGDAMVSTVGLMTDEFFHSGTFPTRQEFERRNINRVNGTLLGVFRNVHRARRALENAADFIKANAAQPLGATEAAQTAEMHSLAGFTYIFFAENYCSGMPYSKVEGGELQYGGPQTTVQTLDIAIAHFDSALKYAGLAGSAAQTNLARVGKARAQLNKGDFAGAAATAAPVPTSFVYRINHSITSARQENSLHSLQFVQRRWSLANNEGINGLYFRVRDGAVGPGTDPTQGDPRIPWSRRSGPTGIGFDQSSPLFDQLKYPARNSPTPLADGVEARLIEAENYLRLGDPRWLTTLNTLRSGVSGLAPLTDPGTPEARVNLLFKERAFWLFATAHRLGDMRRLVRQYGRNPDTVYPRGTYFKGGVYGTDLSLPIPFEEGNNSQFQETSDCQARSAN
jgi:hypothetical protein